MLPRREALVESLVRQGLIKDRGVVESLLKVPRELFIPEELRSQAYLDHPLPIGHGMTISAPHMVAIMNETLQLKKRYKVLEVGAGSGYHAATIAEIVAPRGMKDPGHVYTVERIPELVEFSRKNLSKTGYSDRVTVILGDGSLGYRDEAPYDRISVTAAAPETPPTLISQLAKGGILVIPVGGPSSYQSLMVVHKDIKGNISKENMGGCVFVPLKGKYGFKG